jgi:hypothetical protein
MYTLKSNDVEPIYTNPHAAAEDKPHKFLPSNFVSAIVGKPMSGKSYLVLELLSNAKLYNKFFNYVYFFSPNILDVKKCVSG